MKLIICSLVVCGLIEIGLSEKKTPFSRCNYGQYRYLAQRMGPYVPPDWNEECHYYHCEHTLYKQVKCPRGSGIDPKYLALGDRGKATRYNPCTKFVEPVKCGYIAAPPTRDLSFCGIDLEFVVDISCSIKTKDKEAVIVFIKNIIRKFHIHQKYTQVGGITYAADIFDIQFLKDSRNRARTLLNFDRMVTKDKKCHTVTDKALKHIMDKHFVASAGDRPDPFKNVLMIITDGQTYHGRRAKGEENDQAVLDTIKYGKMLRERGIKVVVVGLPNKQKNKMAGFEEWLAMAGSSEDVFVISTFDDLEESVLEIAAASCVHI